MSVWDSVTDTASSIWHTVTDPIFGPSTPAAPQLTPQQLADQRNMEAAQVALASKLHVVDGDGPRKGNEVSAEEMARMQAMYADLLGDKTNVTFDGKGAPDPKAFKGKAIADMSNMMTTPAGRILLSELVKKDDPTGKDTVPALHLEYTKARNSVTHEDVGDYSDGYPDLGTQTIRYGAGESFDSGPNHFDSDVTLFHEMVHAYHDRTKTDRPDHELVNPVQPCDSGVKQEEYNTVDLHRAGEHAAVSKVNGIELSENEYRRELTEIGREMKPREVYRGERLAAEQAGAQPF